MSLDPQQQELIRAALRQAAALARKQEMAAKRPRIRIESLDLRDDPPPPACDSAEAPPESEE